MLESFRLLPIHGYLLKELSRNFTLSKDDTLTNNISEFVLLVQLVRLQGKNNAKLSIKGFIEEDKGLSNKVFNINIKVTL